MNNRMNTQAQYLEAGMILADSGFIVTRDAYRDDRTPDGKVIIEGHYPGDVHTMAEWKARLVVSVVVN